MSKDALFTDGVIAVKENVLLKDKILKLCEGSAEEALRVLTESGFGKGAEVNFPHEYEKLIEADGRDLDGFIREYSPSFAVTAYLSAPRDFHNLKALLKAHMLGQTAEGMLAPDGLYTVKTLEACVEAGDFSALGKQLKEVAEKVYSSFTAEGGSPLNGAEIGSSFAKAEFEYLFANCGKNGLLKKLLIMRADMLNILTAFRSNTPEYAVSNCVAGGKIKAETLEKLFSADGEKAVAAFENTGYEDFVKLCLKAREKGLPCTEAEKIYNGAELDFLAENKYELKREQPFLYYVFRRRAENDNVRTLFVCLSAGMDEADIKRRMRAV